MKKLITTIAASLVCIMGLAIEYHPIDTAGMATIGATHVLTIRYSDLTATNPVTYSQTITGLTTRVNTLIVPVAGVLTAPFIPTGTNDYNSTTIALGIPGSTAVFAAANQVNNNGTPVYILAGASASAYSTATQMIFTVAGKTNYPLNIFTSGEYKVYLKMIERGGTP